MKTVFAPVCCSLLAIGVLFPAAKAAIPMTVKELEAEFKKFGPEYIKFRKMSNANVQAKEDAFVKVWEIVMANHWERDLSTFYLCCLDLAAFKTENTTFRLEEIFFSNRTKNVLKGTEPLSLFEDIAKDKVTVDLEKKLNKIKSLVKRKLASGKDITKIAYHHELFNGQDLDNPENPKARKDYVLIMIQIAIK